ncbi:hypothetical protein L798_02173 [Zootermopsis nevadensis]|uniref:Uncharacterized protein n=1 Tax=Zootermopsis nevadensis TaxID=136037 RepID=A0A067RJ19_ZOONE|nr:hypothetical protein L798_02173 [Zootermopsis nevadensis]
MHPTNGTTQTKMTLLHHARKGLIMVLALANYHAEEKKPERITKNARERER